VSRDWVVYTILLALGASGTAVGAVGVVLCTPFALAVGFGVAAATGVLLLVRAVRT